MVNPNPFFKERKDEKNLTPTTPGNTNTISPAVRSTTPPHKPAPQQDLLNIATKSDRYFKSDMGEVYASLTINGHRETLKVLSEDFRKYLKWTYHKTRGKVIPGFVVQDVQDLIVAKVTHEGPEETVHKRVAGSGGSIYIDIGDKDRQIIHITPIGWSITRNAPVSFIRNKAQQPLPLPRKGGSILELQPFTNVKDYEDFLILVAFIIRALCPTGPYPILDLQGEAGCGKSSDLSLLQKLIDPSFMSLRRLPDSDRDIFIGASNAWMLAYDNVSRISPSASNALCMLSTGGGFGTRALYTDSEEIFIKTRQPVAIAGINDLMTEKDLGQRSLVLHMPPIEHRQTEREFWNKFNAVYPSILGNICDILSCALRNTGLGEPGELPRMADFVEWVTAARDALPPSERTFVEIYNNNQKSIMETLRDDNPLVQAVLSLMQSRTEWKGTASEALYALGKQACISQNMKYSSAWPRAANKLRHHLHDVEGHLRECGIRIEFDLRANQGIKLMRFLKQPQVTDLDPDTCAESASFHEIVTDIVESEFGILDDASTLDDYCQNALSSEEQAEHPSDADDEEEGETYQSIFP